MVNEVGTLNNSSVCKAAGKYLRSMQRTLLLLVLTLNDCLPMRSQFTNVTYKSVINLFGTEGLYGNGLSLYDFNKDGLDDLTCCSKDGGVRTFINDGDVFSEVNLFPYISGDIKQVMWVDYDNDDDADFFCTIYEASCMLFRNDNALGFVNVTDSLNLPSSTGKSFGAAWADFDRDGFLDVYVCNYDFILPQATTNWFFKNNGMGSFEEMASALGCDNDMRASFQPAWIDNNFDFYPDLFVINDKYHGNAFYKNNQGVFEDASGQSQLDHQMESMSNSWSDFDNDLDFDLYVSNTVQGNILMRKDGDLFENIASVAGVEVGSVCWSALWMDYDHNGKDDLHVSTNSPGINGNQNFLFRSASDSTFYPANIQGDNAPVIASAMGDINADGYIDFIEMKQYPLGIKVYQNNGGDRHWLKLSLHGTASNHNGVGALIRYFIQGEEKIRATFCGENFISQNSQYEILSLNGALEVDSLFVAWPSGWTDKFYHVEADQMFQIVEGSTFEVQIVSLSNVEMCPGDSITLVAETTGNIQWADGSITQQLVVHAPGEYTVVATHDLGWSAQASILIAELSTPMIDWQTTHPTCADSSNGSIEIIFNEEEIVSLEWVGLEVNESALYDLSEGSYDFIVTDYNGCHQTGSIELIQPLPLSLQILSDTICQGMAAELVFATEGGIGQATVEWSELNPNAVEPGTYVLSAHDENLCVATCEFFIEEFSPISLDQWIIHPSSLSEGSISLDVSGGLPPYTFLWNDGTTSNSIENLSEGVYSCDIQDAAGCIVHFEAPLFFNSMDEIAGTGLVVATFFDNVLNLRVNQPTPVRVHDITGKLLLEEVIMPSSGCIVTSSWCDGVYLMKTKNSTIRLIKTHR